MTDKPTPEQIQRACDLANGPNDATPWFPGHYGACTVITALADTIAKLDAMQVNYLNSCCKKLALLTKLYSSKQSLPSQPPTGLRLIRWTIYSGKRLSRGRAVMIPATESV